ncbi:MAG: signal peptidase I [Candidatus Kerfeldbacteria bacterium]|nr:signal peptidase I [Candidatus Kerfeldbacteria bacterium]
MSQAKNFSTIIKAWLLHSGNFIIEVAKVVVISLAIILPIRYFLIQPFYVKGASMEPNYHDYEYLIIDELSYRFSPPQRGQVVVLNDPRNHKQFFIKRIVGLPGETIIFKNGTVVVNGDVLDESVYLASDVMTNTFSGQSQFTLQDDQYFVMGDNREQSYDSRRFGPVDIDTLVGRVWIRAWPLDRLAIFD